MKTFISETLQDILSNTKSLENVKIVLPSKRAKVFVKKELKDKISLGFFPDILSIEELIEEISEIQQVDNIQLLFEFYNIYKSEEEQAITFDSFSSWAFTVLQDFNEIDQHLIDANDIFLYIRDIERLKKWSVKGTLNETDLIKNHNFFLQKLNNYYVKLYSFLEKNKIGYQGLMYREAYKNIDNYLIKNKLKSFYLVGFNALNKAEELIFQKILEQTNSEVYWDIDTYFLQKNHLAAKFIKNYKTSWKYYEDREIKTISSNFFSSKNIQIIGAAKNVTQIKYVGELLSNTKSLNNTALVLADETLLPIVLNSLPKNIDSINITMGYPLKDVSATNLFYNIFKLFLNQEKFNKTTENEFYYKDILQFFNHPSIYNLLPDINIKLNYIAEYNLSFLNKSQIFDALKIKKSDIYVKILDLFDAYDNLNILLQRIINLIEVLKENTTVLEKEYLFRFYTIFNQLFSLQNQYNHFTSLKVLFQFFKQIVAQESLSFQGEPLKGLQLMGMLETRVLDFENVILVSANEGVLPANFQKNSFIPFDVKLQFSLPTYKEKDAIFSYHFFRLLQRAKQISILYNTQNDSFGKGEKSRFVTQLEMMNFEITRKIISPKVETTKKEIKVIEKNEEIQERLKQLAIEGFSPSSITNYLRNPLDFYKQKILKIREFNNVEETVAANTLGTIVHETLDELYSPYEGQFLKVDILNKMKSQADNIVKKKFKLFFRNGDITTGKNRLIFEVSKRFVQNFLDKEVEIVSNPKNTLKILATEQDLNTQIVIEGINFPIKLHGKVDRVDELNGEIRIIDYKTGFVDSFNLKVSDFDELGKEKYHKALQVLFYVFLFRNSVNFKEEKPLIGGIYSFKNVNKGILTLNFSSKNNRKVEKLISAAHMEYFYDKLSEIILEIFDNSKPFIENSDLI